MRPESGLFLVLDVAIDQVGDVAAFLFLFLEEGVVRGAILLDASLFRRGVALVAGRCLLERDDLRTRGDVDFLFLFLRPGRRGAAARAMGIGCGSNRDRGSASPV